MTIGRHCNGKYCVCCNKLLFKLFRIVVNRCCMSPAAGETQLLIGISLFYCSIYTSRDTVVCRAAQKAVVPPVSILTGRKKTQFSHLCSSVIPYPIETKFAREVPASKGSQHTKFEENRSSYFRDTSEHNFVLISSFSSSTSSFRTLRKIRHKTRMRTRIELKFGTLKGLIKADLCTNLGRNPMNIHGVINGYLRNIRSKVCHAYRVNSFEESVENYYVDGATIVGVPFCGLKGIGIKTTEI